MIFLCFDRLFSFVLLLFIFRTLLDTVVGEEDRKQQTTNRLTEFMDQHFVNPYVYFWKHSIQ